MPKLSITTTDGSTIEFELTAERARIGRAQDNDLVVPDGSVSSYHGEIQLTDSGIEIHDLGSTNGTHVNGQRVEKAAIAPGSTFRLGSCHATLVAPEAADEAPAGSFEESAEDAGDTYSEPAMTNSAAAITGLGATPCPTQMRRGFGPKVKKKEGRGSSLMLVGVLGLVACAAGAFMILRMGS